MHSSAKRLQTWFNENSIPLKIRKQIGGYRLFFIRPYGIQVYLKYNFGVDMQFLSELKAKTSTETGFTSNDLVKLLDIPKRSLIRKINELLRLGVIKKGKGSGRSTRYFIIG